MGLTHNTDEARSAAAEIIADQIALTEFEVRARSRPGRRTGRRDQVRAGFAARP